jgi:hypothetical protein
MPLLTALYLRALLGAAVLVICVLVATIQALRIYVRKNRY